MNERYIFWVGWVALILGDYQMNNNDLMSTWCHSEYKINEYKMNERNVKVGRYMIVPWIAQHWALQVGDTWYEVYDPQVNGKNFTGKMKIRQSKGYAAESGAGKFGGSIVGKTTKCEDEIIRWINEWWRLNPTYMLLSENCQAFVFHTVIWLTNNNYKIDFMAEAAAVVTPKTCSALHPPSAIIGDGFTASEKGNGIAAWTISQSTKGNTRLVVGQFGAQAVAGPGLGLFVDVTLIEFNIHGLHYGLNLNTGAGIRNGNLEAHLLGFGGKIGADGIEVNTPIGGLEAFSVIRSLAIQKWFGQVGAQADMHTRTVFPMYFTLFDPDTDTHYNFTLTDCEDVEVKTFLEREVVGNPFICDFIVDKETGIKHIAVVSSVRSNGENIVGITCCALKINIGHLFSED